MRSYRLPLIAGATLLALFASHATTYAVCPSDPLWQVNIPVTQPVSDMSFGYGLTFYGSGPTLRAVWNETGNTPVPHTAGTVAWTWSTPTGATIENFPSPVPLANGGEYIFLPSMDGYLYKVEALTGTPWLALDLRRPGCSSDHPAATPAIQLYNFSNPAFQNHVVTTHGFPDDVVYVATYNGCGDHAANRVYAIWASNMTIKWTFNSTGAFMVDSITDGPTVDPGTNRLYVGNLQFTPSEMSLWGLNALTGVPMWSTNAGSIQNRPILRTGSPVYVVVDNPPAIRSYSPAIGTPNWTDLLPTTVTRNIWPEFRAPLPNRIDFTLSDGTVRSIEDAGSSYSDLWGPVAPEAGVTFTSMPVVVPAMDGYFVGRSDGRVQQLSASTGMLEGISTFRFLGSLYDPIADVSSLGSSTVDRLVVPSNGSPGLARFCIPWTGASAAPEPVTAVSKPVTLNAPNPFTDRTRIVYTLPEAARVQIAIFDLSGRRIRVLDPGDQPAGRQSIEWDGLDQDGHTVASGHYFYSVAGTGAEGKHFEVSHKIERIQ